MTNLQHLLAELEQKQQELQSKLAKAVELKSIVETKHKDNLIKIQAQVDHDVTEVTLDSSLVEQDKIDFDISKLKIELSDIKNALNEIFKL